MIGQTHFVAFQDIAIDKLERRGLSKHSVSCTPGKDVEVNAVLAKEEVYKQSASVIKVSG